jgi:hypothetical protein
MPRLHTVFSLAAPPSAVATSVGLVRKQRKFLDQFDGFDDFIFRASEVDPKATKAIEFHLVRARAWLARLLWKHEVFLGVDLIDRILFDIVQDAAIRDPFVEFLDRVLKFGLHKPGFVVFPLHSFGVMGLGLFRFLRKNQLTYFSLARVGVVLTAQTNSLARAKEFLEHARKTFKISQKIDNSSIDHFYRSRSLRWLDNNPMLAVKIASVSGTYYENQFVYSLKLKIVTALVMMLSVMAEQFDKDKQLTQGSSRRINNWQTLDIRHYLTFERRGATKKKLTSYCIPMNVDSLQLAHLSDLNVDIDPRAWIAGPKKKMLDGVHGALRTIEAGYLQYVILATSKKLHERVYRKLLESIEYFRRSFSSNARSSEATVFLAIAIETLLIDHFSPGMTERLVARAQFCMRGVPGTRKYQQAILDLFKMRGSIVHLGEVPPKGYDLHEARRAYVLCLQKIASRLHELPNQSGRPIGEILGVVD